MNKLENSNFEYKNYSIYQYTYQASEFDEKELLLYNDWFNNGTFNVWRHKRMLSQIDVMLSAYLSAVWLTVGVIEEVEDAVWLLEGVTEGLEDAVWLTNDVSEAVCVCVGDCELDEVTDCDEVGLLVGDTDTVGLGLEENGITS
jgi:hypothetical protein